jgi:hypothetical protein
MARILGARALIDNALPSTIDTSYVMNFEMQEAMRPEEVITMAATTIGEANEYLMETYGGLVYVTEKLWSTYKMGNGSRRMTPKGSEFVEEDGDHSEKTGHMLFLEDYKDATAWSRDYLERAIREDLRGDVIDKRDDWINRVDYDVMTAMFRSSEVTVGAGWSAPWAIPTGTNTNFIPPQWMTNSFDTNHTHFVRVNAAPDGTNVLTALETGARHLAHHGHTGRKVAYVGDTIADLITASTDKRVAIQYPVEFTLTAGNSGAPISTIRGQLEGVPGEIIALVTTKSGLVEVRRHDRVPAGYIWIGKSYGRDNQKNPLAIRVYPGKGFGLTVNPQIDRSINPTLDRVMFKGTHGVNVNDRTAGVAIQIASGGTTYEEPTISA